MCSALSSSTDWPGRSSGCAAGVPAVIYGAGPRTVLESNAKRADEHLALADLRRATKVVARSLADLLTTD